MTNSSPQPPLPPRPPENHDPSRNRRPIVTFDEIIAIIVAFSTIGAILFWSLGGRRGQMVSGWKNNLFSVGSRAEKAKVSARGDVTGEFSGRTSKLAIESDREPTSQDLRQPTESVAANGRKTTDTFLKPNRESLSIDRQQNLLARTAATGAGLAVGDRVLRSRDTQTQVTAPEKPDTSPTATTPTPGEKPDTSPTATTPTPGEKPDTSPTATTPTPGEKPDTSPTATTPTPGEKPDTSPTATTPTPGEKPDTFPQATKLTFKDVPQDHWAFPFVTKLGADRLRLNDSQENFNPDRPITRASMATLISQSFEQPKVKQLTKNFSDMPKQKALAKSINEAVSTGFMKGYSDNEFRPQEKIPRYQVLVALASGLGLPTPKNASQILSKFTDRDRLPDWAKDQVAAATAAGLAVNRPSFKPTSLNPSKSATRAEVAGMIHQALVKSGKLKPIKSQYIVKP